MRREDRLRACFLISLLLTVKTRLRIYYTCECNPQDANRSHDRFCRAIINCPWPLGCYNAVGVRDRTVKDLYRCLDEYAGVLSTGYRRGLANTFAQSGCPRHGFALAEAMLVSQALPELLPTLSPGAQQALAEIVAEGGIVPGHRLVARYGSIRRLGPAAIGREQPWLAPANPVEELYYRGLDLPYLRHHGRLYGRNIPRPRRPLGASRPTLGACPACGLGRGGASLDCSGRRPRLVEDLFAFLVRIRLAPPVASWGRALVADAEPDLMGLDQRMLGERTPQRVALIRRMLSACT